MRYGHEARDAMALDAMNAIEDALTRLAAMSETIPHFDLQNPLQESSLSEDGVDVALGLMEARA